MPTIATRNARIQYWKTGSGPAVLLVQGAGVIGEGWRPQIDALKDRYTVIWIDNRGIGQSALTTGPLTVEDMAADVLAVADAESIARFHLIGHSMGGLIAQQVALIAPRRVVTLALLCTFLKGPQATALSWPMLLLGLRSRIGTRRMRRQAFAEMVMPASYLAAVDRTALCESLAGLFGRDLADQPPIVMQQLRAMGRFDGSARTTSSCRTPATRSPSSALLRSTPSCCDISRWIRHARRSGEVAANQRLTGASATPICCSTNA